MVFEAILRMGCSKLGCKISTLGALSAGKTEAPPGKMLLEMDISCHMCAITSVSTVLCIVCARFSSMDVSG